MVVRIPMMNMARRNRMECEGFRTCATRESISAINVKAAAMTCTIRILDSPLLADGGREKLFDPEFCRDSRDLLDDVEAPALCSALSIISESSEIHKPGLYPNCTEEHFPLTQKPNTPKLTPLKLPRAIFFVIGTEMTESNNSTKAATRNTVAGVAARGRIFIL